MTDYTYPGVYIEEVPQGPGPITGVSTSNLGLIGFSTKGPVNEPTICTSYPEFARKFGSFTEKSLSPTEAFAFFQNGGQVMYFVRVTASDATDAYWNFNATVTDEQVSNTAQLTGVYDLTLDETPVASATLSITFENAGTPANVNVFTADSSGVLTLDTANSGASAEGGTGSIDVETGEVHVELVDQSQFTGTTDYITATYSYTVFKFEMAWPGLDGNYYRIRVEPGSDDYLTQATASWSRFTVMVDEDLNQDATNRSWITRETFADLVFDDSTHASYVATVINAEGTGSDLIEVVDYGNAQNPSTLQGSAVTAEDVSASRLVQGSTGTPPTAYDGSTKAWEYTLANAPYNNTLSMEFRFSDGELSHSGTATSADAVLTDTAASFGGTDALLGKIVVNVTQGASAIITASTSTTVTGVLTGGAVTWLEGDEYAVLDPSLKIGTGTADVGGEESVISPGTVSNPVSIVPGSVSMTWTDSVDAVHNIIDDGSGNLWDGVDGSCATISYTTGQITGISGTPADALTLQDVTAWSALVAKSASDITFSCIYVQPVAIEDDADGNITVSSTQETGYPAKFELNTSATNTVDYTTGVVNLTWKISGNPGIGPGGTYSETASYYYNSASSFSSVLTGGTDGTDVASTDIISPDLAVDYEGLYAFGKVDAMMTLVASDFQTDVTVSGALITYAELMKDKFVPITAPAGLTYQEAINWKKHTLNTFTSYAAMYYPHIKILDPVTNTNLDVPCGGHVAGIFARTDSTRNVGEAPAGIEKGALRWTTGLECNLTPTQAGLLNKDKINTLVQWDRTGNVVWGARTLDSAGGSWPYIQMRRLFMYVEKSVFNSTHIHVFENNNATLWSRIRMQVSTFLLGLHNSGYFKGKSADQSYFVICDETNNPQNTVDQGIVYCDVGLAPNKPAEFVVFRFSQILSSE